jgi:carboxymethylenebutenolidase
VWLYAAGLYGGKDAAIPLHTVEQMRQVLQIAHKPGEIHAYPEAQHGFNSDYRPGDDPGAARDAWAKMLAFFQKHGV